MARHDPGAGAPNADTADFLAGPTIGNVLALTLHSSASTASGQVLAVPAVQTLARYGLEGDRHADPCSPRQVLLAGAPAYARHGLARHTLRENVLLDVDTTDLPSGALLRLGDMAVVGLTFHCEACRYLDSRHPGIAGVIGRDRGVLARVVRGGVVRVGDPVVRLAARALAWSDDWRERVVQVLAQVPLGMVVEYRQLARLAGVQAVYCRALPALARRLGMAERAVAQGASAGLLRWMGDTLFDSAADAPCAGTAS